MTRPPHFPFHDPTEALEALLEGTYWPKAARWAEHMRVWLAAERPPLGRQHPAFPTMDTPESAREAA